jgi:predicted dienelactone hydrolase
MGDKAQIADLAVSIWRPSPETKKPLPLVIFSHGFHGSSTQSKFLMKALADAGYLVIAPNHKDALRRGGQMNGTFKPEVSFAKPEEWTDASYRDRGDDIKRLIKALKTDQTWSKEIDWAKVGLAGHSLGGYTVLGLAGAWPSWKDRDVKAVLALSPYCAPFVQKKTLGGIGIPVMYQGGTRDMGITPSVMRPGGAYDQTSGPAYFIDFDGAGHFGWTDLRPDFEESIDYYAVAFFDKYLKGDRAADPIKKLPDVTEVRSK